MKRFPLIVAPPPFHPSLRYIEELQNPPDCSNRKRKWHVAALTDFGLGSVLAHQFTQTLVKAWASGLPVVMSNSAWRYADEDRKCGPGYSCMMRPLSHCKIEELQPSQASPPPPAAVVKNHVFAEGNWAPLC